jgi:hypothetical protein
MSVVVSLVLFVFFCALTSFACRSLRIAPLTFIAAHESGTKLTVIVASVTMITLKLFHDYGFAGLMPLLGVGVSLGLIGLLLLSCKSHWLVGDVGVKVLGAIQARILRIIAARRAA